MQNRMKTRFLTEWRSIVIFICFFCMIDFSVPFENNISERDLRKAKNRQKMAGRFRKESGHEMYCSILTIIETLKRRNMGIIENIKHLFMGPGYFLVDAIPG